MKQIVNKPVLIFIILMCCIALPLFLLPINLFSGEIVLQNGITEAVVQAPLSLSYFIGMGYNPEDMMDVKNFYLLPAGYIFAVALIVGLPALISYRVWMAKNKTKKNGLLDQR